MLRFTPVSIGIPTLFGVFLFRHFLLIHDGIWLSDDKDTTTATTMSLIGGGFLLFIFTASKAQMLFFVFHCKVMRNAFAIWNG